MQKPVFQMDDLRQKKYDRNQQQAVCILANNTSGCCKFLPGFAIVFIAILFPKVPVSISAQLYW